MEEEEKMDEGSFLEDCKEYNDIKYLCYHLRCRCIRIGSYKVRPMHPNSYIDVLLTQDNVQFNAPILSKKNKLVHITLGFEDIMEVYIHLGECLPVIFILTTPKFALLLRKSLGMISGKTTFFDPLSKDETTQRLTFLIETVTDVEAEFIFFLLYSGAPSKIFDIDHKKANELLIGSTPLQVGFTDPKKQYVEYYYPKKEYIKYKNMPAESELPKKIFTDIRPKKDYVEYKNIPAENKPPKKVLPKTVRSYKVPPHNKPPNIEISLRYPARSVIGSTNITSKDFRRLNHGRFLNDTIVDFYLNYLSEEKLLPFYKQRTHIFNCFFYSRLTFEPKRTCADNTTETALVMRHNQFKSYTKRVDIFSKDFLIIPVNQVNHWILAIICYASRVPESEDLKDNSINGSESSPYDVKDKINADSTTNPDGKQKKEKPCICIFDSYLIYEDGPLRGAEIGSVLQEFLNVEWKVKKRTNKLFNNNTLPVFVRKCPQQENDFDCGIFMLQFAESFLEYPIIFYNPNYDLSDWFPVEITNQKRHQIQELILILQEKQNAREAEEK